MSCCLVGGEVRRAGWSLTWIAPSFIASRSAIARSVVFLPNAPGTEGKHLDVLGTQVTCRGEGSPGVVLASVREPRHRRWLGRASLAYCSSRQVVHRELPFHPRPSTLEEPGGNRSLARSSPNCQPSGLILQVRPGMSIGDALDREWRRFHPRVVFSVTKFAVASPGSMAASSTVGYDGRAES